MKSPLANHHAVATRIPVSVIIKSLWCVSFFDMLFKRRAYEQIISFDFRQNTQEVPYANV